MASRLLGAARLNAAQEERIDRTATGLIEAIRANDDPLGGVEDMLREFALSTKEGLALMVLAEALLRVPDDSVKGIRSSSEPYALLKARMIRELLGATWGLAETGASGPTGNRYGDAAGHACIAVAGPVERAITLETGHGDREKNMWAFTKAALDLLETSLRKSR